MRIASCAIGLLALAACTGTARDSSDLGEVDLLVSDVHVLPMTSDTVLHRRTLVINKGRIVAILGSSDRPPSARRVVDGSGLFAMPGLIDMHVHLRSVNALSLYLGSGVTTVRNMNGAFGDPLTWRSEIASGQRLGPTLVTATPTIRNDAGEDYSYQVRTAADVQRIIADADVQGYDLIKLYQLPAHLLEPLVRGAREHGLTVSGHVPFFAASGSPDSAFQDTLDLVLRSGMASIEHLGGLVYAGLRDDSVGDEDIDALAARVAAANVAVTSTIGQDMDLGSIVLRGEAAHGETRRALIRRYTGDEGLSLLDDQVKELSGSDPWSTDLEMRLAAALSRAGVPILLGTDSHGPNALAGISTVEEVGYLVEAGLSPFEALQAGTSTPARYLGLEGEVGVIAVGVRADVLLLGGDPRSDPGALSAPFGVIVRGQWIPKAQLDSLVAAAVEKGTYCRAPTCEEG